MKIFICKFLFFTLALLDCANATEARFDCFARFKFCVKVPPMLANWVSLSDNGDGGSYQSEDGVSLAVWGSHNSRNTTIKAEFSAALKAALRENNQKVTYQKLSGRYYVLSGYQGDEVFYTMVTLGADDIYRSFALSYPIALKSPDDLIAELIKQFKKIAGVQ